MSTVGKHTQPLSGFSPLSIGGCSLWLDATSTSNFALTGSNITNWYDRSPFSNTATPSNGTPILSNAAINGRPAVYLSNAPSLHGSISLSNAGVAGFMVIRPLTTGLNRNDQRILSATNVGATDYDGAQFFIGIQGNSTELRWHRGGGFLSQTNVNALTNMVVSWNEERDGTAALFLNGATADITASGTSVGNWSISQYAIGNQVTRTTEYFNGFVGEVILYNDSLTATQRQAVEGYLAWKWGIAPSLATTFSPLTSLSNCALWFDGADATTLTLSGSNITTWRDKAASNTTTNLGTPVYTSNAVNGGAGVAFDVNAGFQVSPMSNAANRTTLSVYTVFTTGSGAQNNARILTVGRISDGATNNDYSASNLWTLFRAGDGSLGFNHAGSGITAAGVLGVGTPALVSIVFTGTSASAWFWGSNFGSLNTTNTLIFDRFGIAKNINANAGSQYDSFVGTFGEVLMFYDAHTEAQRLQVESYLASKWTVRMRAPLHLVPTHPYAQRRPALRGFQPTDIPGCVVWLDAADPATFTFSSGSNVSLWRDKSPRANTFSNAGTVVLSSNAIVLSGSSFLRSTSQFEVGNTYCTIVTKLTGNAGYAHLTGFDNIQPAATMGSYGIRYDGTKLVSVDAGDYSDLYTVNGTLYATTTAPYNTSTPYASRHIVAGSANRGGTTFIRVGAYTEGRYYIGEIYEVLFYSSVPSTADRLRLEAYLAEKWGLRGSMGGPAHPYKYGPWNGLPVSSPVGLLLWLDAADASSFTLSGSNIVTWKDKSGNGRNATGVNNPTYSAASNAVVFSRASSQYMTLPDGTVPAGSSSFSIFFVFSPVSTAYETIMITAKDVGTGYIWGIRSGSSMTGTLQTFWSGTGDIETSTRWTANARNLGSFFYQTGGTRSLWTNFVQGTSDTPGTPPAVVSNQCIGTLGPGAYNTFDGQFYEILVFNSSLTTTQRQQVEGYLAQKWGLRSSMPVSHPYLTGQQIQVTPAGVPGCTLWLDGADTSTLTLSGSNVVQWNDKSGYGNHHVQTTASNRPFMSNDPVYGRTGLYFNGTSSLVQSNTSINPISNTNTFSIFTAHRLVPTSNIYPLYLGSNLVSGGLRHWLRWQSNFANFITDRDPEGYISFASNNINAMNGVSSFMNDVTTATGFINGTSVGSASKTPNLTNQYFTLTGGFGYFFEFLIFNRLLTTTERQQIEGYLAWKWGIGSNLPGSSSNWAAISRTLTAEFDPRSVGNCGVWFDAADPATFQFSSGSNVNLWLDKSGFQNHLATNTSNAGNWPTLTPNALNGRPVLTFNGASGMQGPYAPTSSTQPQTMFVVARPAVLTGANRVVVQCPTIYQTPGFPNYAMSLVTVGSLSDRWMHSGFYGDNNGVSNGLISSTTRTDIVAGSWRPSRSTLAVNGTEYGESSATPPALATKAANNSKMVIGGGWYFPDNYYRDFFNGYIAEVLIFSSFLTAAERQRVEGYLAWKWGLQSQLPALHPYSNVKF